MRTTFALLAALVAVPSLSTAQPVDSLSQQGRRIISGSLGVGGTADASVGTSGQVATRAGGAVASLAYLQFVTPSLALEVGGTLLGAAASVDYDGTRSNATTALLIGVSYSPRQLALTQAIRPFVSAAVGPYMLHQSAAGFGGLGARIESHAGARLGAGAHLYLARHLALVLEGDYHAVGQFTFSDGSRQDPSGFALTFGLGIAWGR